MKKIITLLTMTLGIFALVGLASASTTEDSASSADRLQPASSLIVEDELQVLGVARVYSLRVGSQGHGGVTYFNGTIINETTDVDTGVEQPVTFGDDIRVDGQLWRGENSGAVTLNVSGINSSMITDGTIVAGDIASNAVTSAKILNGTIMGSDISSSANLSVVTLTTTGSISVGGDVDGVDVSNENSVYYSTTSGSDTNLTTPSANPYPSKIIAGVANVSASGGVACPSSGCSDIIELPPNFFTSNASYNITANQNNPLLTDSELGSLYISRLDGDTFKVYWSSSTYPAEAKIHWQAIGY